MNESESVSSSSSRERPTVSACIISFNEEKNIRACLESVSWCDEIVVVDSFSQDRTVDIARELGARVLQSEWKGHVAQKNLALDEARCDWVLALDCDERVTPRLRDLVLDQLGRESVVDSVDGFYVSRKLRYLGRWLAHGGWFPEWRMRVFRRERGRWVGVDPHDTVRLDGKSSYLRPGTLVANRHTAGTPASSNGEEVDSAVILHYSFRDLSHQLKVLDRYTGIQSGELSRKGRLSGLLDITLRPVWRFVWTYILRGGFLDGRAGFHMAVNHAYAAYMKYARLWEIRSGLTEPTRKEELVPAFTTKATREISVSDEGPAEE